MFRGRLFSSFLDVIGYIGLWICSIVFFSPVIWMISTALKVESDVLTLPLRWIPKRINLTNFTKVTYGSSYPVGKAFWNSSVVAIATVVLVLFITSLAAYAFARMEFKGKNLLFTLALSTIMVPGEVTIVPLFLLMWKLGLANSHIALIVPSLSSAFGVFLLRQFFLSIPRDLEDAARIDGCSQLRIFYQIILPLAKPALSTLSIFTFLSSWNSYTWPLVVITRAEMMTLPICLSYLQSTIGYSRYNEVMAASVIATVPSLIVFLVSQKWIVKGVSLTGLKG